MRKEDIHIEPNGMLEQEMALVLFDFINPMPDKGRLLEVGTGWGESAKFFSELKPDWFIYTIDSFGLYGDGRVYQYLDHNQVKEVFDDLAHCKNIIQILGDSATVPWELPIDVLYIDGNHTYQGCKADFERYSPFLKQGSLCIFDDYIQEGNPTNGVKKVVDELKGYEVLYKGISAIVRKIG